MGSQTTVGMKTTSPGEASIQENASGIQGVKTDSSSGPLDNGEDDSKSCQQRARPRIRDELDDALLKVMYRLNCEPLEAQSALKEQESSGEQLAETFRKTIHVSPAIYIPPRYKGQLKQENIKSDSQSGEVWPRRKGYTACSREPSFRSNLTEFQPEWQEIDDLVKTMRKILHNPKYEDDDRLSPDDELAVFNILKYHHKFEEKAGPGIDYIKIKQVYDASTRCFWVVRTDGTETDFSFHKCLRVKAAREVPSLLDHYEMLYQTRWNTSRTHGTWKNMQP